MGKDDFSRTECIRALTAIGFKKKNKRSGKHDKYVPPDRFKGNFRAGRRPFVMVPHGELHVQQEIVSEIKSLCGEEMAKEFLKKI